jgi:hypothetical protein
VLDPLIRQRNLALLAEGESLVESAGDAGITIRLLGGVAVLHHCTAVLAAGGSRSIADLDLMVRSGQGRRLATFLVARDYQPEVRFNALHGQDRMLFHGPLGQLDVLIGAFEMCHRLDFEHRLLLETPTLSATDLLLTKLQIVELNEKDTIDALDLLESHELSQMDGDVVNLKYLGDLTAHDWGLWRTVSGTLGRLEREQLSAATALKIGLITDALKRAPKSLKWKVRAQIGEHRRWFTLPDEVN